MHLRGQQFQWGDRTYLMGVLNVTPDSFSDGGKYNQLEQALDRVREMAPYIDILDIGGESTRPGATPVPLQEELARVIPVIEAVRSYYPNLVISLDTMKAKVALAGIKAGADIINDVTSGRYDDQMFPIVGKLGAPLVLMHMQGTPQTMQANPHYTDVVTEIIHFLLQRSKEAQRYGIEHLIVDPGIGFGKTLEHNLTILRHLHLLKEMGYPLLLGVSRKSFIGKLTGQANPQDRLLGTAAACTIGIANGADILRVHDPQPLKEVCLVADAIYRATSAKKARGAN